MDRMWTYCRCSLQKTTKTEHNPIRGLIMNADMSLSVCMGLSLYERKNMSVAISLVKMKSFQLTDLFMCKILYYIF